MFFSFLLLKSSVSAGDPWCPLKEAMEALLAALGHDVVELDRLQVQRSECKVADKWKVELCHLAGWWYYGIQGGAP